MKYAYLIIANRNHKQLQLLIDMLDDSRNDIYLIIDKKSKNFPYNFRTNYSSINYVKPLDIYWGGYSIVKAELRLFKAAAPQHYTYYHLLSGLDLPLYNQDYIHSFFDEHPNKEFIGYGDYTNKTKMKNNIDVRIKHHLFRKRFRNKDFISRIYRGLERRLLQYCVKGKIPSKKIGYASQWVSISDGLVQLIVKYENWIKYIFKYSLCPDELFIPTLINFHSRFLNKIYYNDSYIPNENFNGNLRLIYFKDSKSYSPYIWRIYDYKYLIKAKQHKYLFSRKFDWCIDKEIILKLFNNIMK